MLDKFLIVIILLLYIKSGSFALNDSNYTILNTLNGKIQGKLINVTLNSNDSTQVLIWHAVPYAEAPIDKLRFKSPVPVKSWKQTINGTKPAKACIQPFIDQNSTSEDCLYLNIYSPYISYIKSVVQNDKSYLLPILVWIHGGSFRYGSSSDIDGSILAAKSNLIVVTISYRLGIFGFFHMNETGANGNQALLDQNLALKWIYRNAEKFGGIRTKITISGSNSIGYHLIFQSSWPYFTNAILQSGNPVTLEYETLLLTPGEATDLASSIGSKIGCWNKTAKDLFECIQTSNTSVLNSISETLKLPAFVLNNNVFSQHPRQLFELGKFKSCNILLGYNNFEEFNLGESEIGKKLTNEMIYGNFNSFKLAIMKRLETNESMSNKMIKLYVPRNKIYDKTINYYNYFVSIITDYQYKCPTYMLADYYININAEPFVYLYAHKASNSDIPIDGATNSEEIPFKFGYPLGLNQNFSVDEQIFSEKLVNYWSNFTFYSRPSLAYDWPKFNENRLQQIKNLFYLKANAIKFVKISAPDQKCQFWNSFSMSHKCSNDDCFREKQ